MLKTPRPIKGPHHAPTLGYLIPPVGSDDVNLWIGIRPIDQTARTIGHRDNLIDAYYVSILAGGKIKAFRKVELIEEFSPDEGEYQVIDLETDWDEFIEQRRAVVIPGLTPWKAAEHHAHEYAEYGRAANSSKPEDATAAGASLPGDLRSFFAEHAARFAAAARDGITERGYAAALEQAITQGESRG